MPSTDYLNEVSTSTIQDPWIQQYPNSGYNNATAALQDHHLPALQLEGFRDTSSTYHPVHSPPDPNNQYHAQHYAPTSSTHLQVPSRYQRRYQLYTRRPTARATAFNAPGQASWEIEQGLGLPSQDSQATDNAPAEFAHGFVQPAPCDHGVSNESSPDQQPVVFQAQAGHGTYDQPGPAQINDQYTLNGIPASSEDPVFRNDQVAALAAQNAHRQQQAEALSLQSLAADNGANYAQDESELVQGSSSIPMDVAPEMYSGQYRWPTTTMYPTLSSSRTLLYDPSVSQNFASTNVDDGPQLRGTHTSLFCIFIF